MYEKIYDNPDIYKIYVPLPNNPLKNLNCYVIKTPEKNLIIDTGFNMIECYDALKEGLEQLQIDIDKTEMFLTHLHSDHIGLVESIMKKDSKIYMSAIDYDYLTKKSVIFWVESDKRFILEGFPEVDIITLRDLNPARIYAPKSIFNAITFEDNYKFKIGSYEFTCILTPGHTPGHACLFIENENIMFLGDHVLFDISPNIIEWYGTKDSLADYLESLKKIQSYDIKTALPAHRKNEMDIYVRINELLRHHDVRLQNTIDVISQNPGFNAYDIAGKMQWSMRGRDWSEFPIQQKWFAVGETLAHLDYLIEDNKIYKKFEDFIYKYYLCS